MMDIHFSFQKLKKSLNLYHTKSMLFIIIIIYWLGHVLITGGDGIGKSTFSKVLCKYSNVYSVFISCKTMAGDRTDTCQLKLHSFIHDAIVNSPSVLILDDLDSICPLEQEVIQFFL